MTAGALTLSDTERRTCTACCRDQLVLLTGNDDPSLYETRAAINPMTGAAALALLQQPDGACQYLGEAGCTIYDRRPEMCRAFSCVGFVQRLMETTTRAERRRIYGKALATDPVWNAGRARLRGVA